MAHSFVQAFPSEFEAFKAYAMTYPEDCVLLIDTYDVLNSGIKNAIKVHNEVLKPNGYSLKGIRLDSGDLSYLSKKVRRILDENFMTDTKIIVSNSMDEKLISSLIEQGAPIDIFGVGENLITSKSSPVFGGVYKLVAIEENGSLAPKIKKSENVEKITTPGFKKLWRLYSKETGQASCDVLTMHDEIINEALDYWFVDPSRPWYTRSTSNFIAVELHQKIFEEGKQVYECPKLDEIREYVKKQLNDETWVEELRFHNPHVHYVNHSQKVYDMKMDLLKKIG